MPNTISVNPIKTTNAPGSFSIKSRGYIQGEAMDDPATRFALAGGILAAGETLPMWGGIGIYEQIPGSSPFLGSTVGRATSLASTLALAGFSVFNQAHAGINTPQSPVPVALPGMSVNFYRLGSGARIGVACDPSLVSLQGGLTSQQVSWDFNTQRLAPYDAATATFALSSVTWANTNGGRLTCVASAAIPFGLGDTVNISGATNTGTGGVAVINKSFVIDTYTDTTHFTLAAPAAAGVYGTIGGSPVINAGTGALNVKVLQVETDNCLTVLYDPTTGYATWNTNDCVALILI